MLSDGKPPPLDRVRRVVGRVPILAVWLLAAGAVWRLSGGALLHGTIARGYADARQYVIAPMTGGLVSELHVEVGAAVKAGQLVARLDGRDLQARLVRMRAELDERRARLIAEGDALESEVTRSEIWVVKVRADAQSDRAELKELEARLHRLESLADNKLVSADELERARRAYAMKSAQIATLDRATASGKAGFADDRLPEASRAAGNHRASVTARLRPYEEAIHVQEAAIRELEVQLDRLELRAPVDGSVALILKRPGEAVAAYGEVVRIVTARTGIVTVPVDEHVARSVSVGGTADLERRTGGKGAHRFRGRVISMSPSIDESPVRARVAPHIPIWGLTVFVQVDGPEELLPGEAFDVRFD